MCVVLSRSECLVISTVYDQQRMKQVYLVERATNTNKDMAGKKEATVRRRNRERNECFQSGEARVESVLL